jgi:phosphopantothenoylcysteine decarboxylase/phosphopantothenate--cysteine ligase
MRCLVTAGPTYEPLDAVRRLTNFSTGRLGSDLAGFLASRGHQVSLLLGEQATFRAHVPGYDIQTFTTTADLRGQLNARAGQSVDAVFHAAAVSDFSFGKIWVRLANGQLTEIYSEKLSSRQGDLLAELRPTPKIITELRSWFPDARLVGWKYEVDGDRDAVIQQARKQVAECSTDACVANGPAYGAGFGLVRADSCIHLADAAHLFEALEGLLRP